MEWSRACLCPRGYVHSLQVAYRMFTLCNWLCSSSNSDIYCILLFFQTVALCPRRPMELLTSAVGPHLDLQQHTPAMLASTCRDPTLEIVRQMVYGVGQSLFVSPWVCPLTKSINAHTCVSHCVGTNSDIYCIILFFQTVALCPRRPMELLTSAVGPHLDLQQHTPAMLASTCRDPTLEFVRQMVHGVEWHLAVFLQVCKIRLHIQQTSARPVTMATLHISPR